jgi:hypothetical protein
MKRLFILVCILSAAACAQAPAKQVVFFSFHHAQLDPPEYTFQVSQDCNAVYTAKPRHEEKTATNDPDAEQEQEPAEENEQGERREVRLSDATCNSILAAAKSLDYFKGDFEFRKHRVAYTGDRVLGYFAPGVSNKTSFTWSENPQVQQLSATFEGIAATLEAGPKLQYLRRFDRLGLNEALKKIEEQARKGWLKELQLLAPELQSIANDGQVMNIARQRARDLLQLAQAATPPAAAKK